MFSLQVDRMAKPTTSDYTRGALYGLAAVCIWAGFIVVSPLGVRTSLTPIAVAPDGFDRIIRLADKNNVVVVPFDNILDTDKVMMVNEDQKEMGRMSAKWLIDESGKKAGDILEVRGLPGNSVDRDRHLGFREVMEGAGNKFNITEVVGNWDTGTSQKVTAD